MSKDTPPTKFRQTYWVRLGGFRPDKYIVDPAERTLLIKELKDFSLRSPRETVLINNIQSIDYTYGFLGWKYIFGISNIQLHLEGRTVELKNVNKGEKLVKLLSNLKKFSQKEVKG